MTEIDEGTGTECYYPVVLGVFSVTDKMRGGSGKTPWLVLLALGVAIAAIQIASGAYSAEFDGYPDEAGQFVSGLLVYDYLTQLPHGNPVDWAAQYYLHYPQIGLGRWPPGFALSEALWWLVARPSRWSSLVLVGAFVWVAAAVFYGLARRIASSWIALSATLLLIAAPAVASSFCTVMADAPCLLASVLVLEFTVRLMERPSGGPIWRIAVTLALALMMKGSALLLIPIPLTAFLIATKQRSKYLLGLGIGVVLVVAAAAGLYWANPTIFDAMRWIAGASTLIPWEGKLALHLAGYGVDVLAAIGAYFALVRRRPAAVVAALALASIVLLSLGLRAMQEPRHWIILIPAIVLLALEAISQLANSRARLALMGVLALAFFPYDLRRQHAEGYDAMAAKIKLPSRMLISSTSGGEGPWIAAIAVREKRPASVVVRASKVLAASGWNGEGYRLLTDSGDQVLIRLDELGIDTVIVQQAAGLKAPPHQQLLQAAISGSRAWGPVETGVGAFYQWSRLKPPEVPRKALEIELNSPFLKKVRESSSR